MAPLRSLGNIRSIFDDFYARTGKDAVNPVPAPVGAEASGGTKINYNNVNYHVFTGTGPFSAPGDFSENVNYIILGGGGGAGYSSPSVSRG